jgi:hypothetical protein
MAWSGQSQQIATVMYSYLFDSFARMIESVPAKAVIRAAEAEQRMVEDDLESRRTVPNEEAISVLGFCHFLTAAARGVLVALPIAPIEHCAFYRKIVQRLVEAGELPFTVKDQFDRTFSRVLFNALMAPG